MMSDSSQTNYRCGYKYFRNPPATRKAQRMSAYRQVELTHQCPKWAPHSPSILRDKFQ